MKTLIFVILFAPYLVYGSWYCEEVASEWMQRGKILQTCGIGRGESEVIAREKAFDNAQKEFNKICNEYSHCGEKAYNVDPMRTSCNSNKNGRVTCHRLVNFHISDRERKVVVKPIVPVFNKTEVHNIYQNEYKQKVYKTINIHKNYYKNGTPIKPTKYKHFVRAVGGISIYETNDRSPTGVHLTNPSEREIELTIKRSQHGGANKIYIHRN